MSRSFRTTVLAVALVAAPFVAPLVARAGAQAAPPAAAALRDTGAMRRADVPADSALADLARAVTVLAESVREAAVRTARSPEVQMAAVQLATRAVTVAHRAVTENTSEVERLLAEAAKRLGELERVQRERAKAAASSTPAAPPAP